MPAPTLTKNQVKAIPLTYLEQDPENIRKTFDKSRLNELAASLKRGQEQPITVRKHEEKYRVVHGERRLRAARIAKLKALDCVLEKPRSGEDADFQRLVSMYAENMDREGLNPIDMAHFYKKCITDYEITVEQLPAMLKEYGIKDAPARSTISNMIRLVELPTWTKQYIQDGKLTPAHGRLLLSVKDLPGIMKKLKQNIDGELADEESNLTTNMLAHNINMVMHEHYPRVDPDTHLGQWMDLEWLRQESDITLYNPEKLSEADRKELGVVSVPSAWSNGKSVGYVTNKTAHKKQQEAAIDKIAERRKKAAERERKKKEKKDAAGKDGQAVPQNTGPREAGLVEYVHDWLMRIIEDELGKNRKKHESIRARLALWAGLNMPEQASDYHFTYNPDESVPPVMFHHKNREAYDETAVAIANTYTLHQALVGEYEFDQAIDAVVERTLAHCNTEHRCYIARVLGLEFEELFRVTDDYLKLYTKAGLLQLAKDHQAEIGNQSKNPDIRKALVDQADKIGCPQHVSDYLADMFKNYEHTLADSQKCLDKHGKQAAAGGEDHERE